MSCANDRGLPSRNGRRRCETMQRSAAGGLQWRTLAAFHAESAWAAAAPWVAALRPRCSSLPLCGPAFRPRGCAHVRHGAARQQPAPRAARGRCAVFGEQLLGRHRGPSSVKLRSSQAGVSGPWRKKYSVARLRPPHTTKAGRRPPQSCGDCAVLQPARARPVDQRHEPAHADAAGAQLAQLAARRLSCRTCPATAARARRPRHALRAIEPSPARRRRVRTDRCRCPAGARPHRSPGSVRARRRPRPWKRTSSLATGIPSMHLEIAQRLCASSSTSTPRTTWRSTATEMPARRPPDLASAEQQVQRQRDVRQQHDRDDPGDGSRRVAALHVDMRVHRVQKQTSEDDAEVKQSGRGQKRQPEMHDASMLTVRFLSAYPWVPPRVPDPLRAPDLARCAAVPSGGTFRCAAAIRNSRAAPSAGNFGQRERWVFPRSLSRSPIPGRCRSRSHRWRGRSGRSHSWAGAIQSVSSTLNKTPSACVQDASSTRPVRVCI